MSRLLYTRSCMDCGKMMHNVAPNRKRCPECVRRHDLVSRRAYEQNKQAQEIRLRREQRVEARSRPLHTDALAATRAGVSYGKYMLTKNRKEG